MFSIPHVGFEAIRSGRVMPGDNGEDRVKRYKGVVARGALAVAALIGIAGAGASVSPRGPAAATPAITVTPSTGLQPQGSTTVSVSGSGLTPAAAGAHTGVQRLRHQPGGVAAAPRSQQSQSLPGNQLLFPAGRPRSHPGRQTSCRVGRIRAATSGPCPSRSRRAPSAHRRRPVPKRVAAATRRPMRPTTHAHPHPHSRRPGHRVSSPSVTSQATRRPRPSRSPEPVSLRRHPPATTWPLLTGASSRSGTCPSAARPEA